MTTSRVDAQRARRRLQALGATGWTAAELAKWVNATMKQLTDVRNGHTQQISVELEAQILGVYEGLWDRPGPDARVADQCSARWPRPQDWVDIDDPDEEPEVLPPDPIPDEVVVEQFLSGRDVRLNRADKAEVLRVAKQRGMNLDSLVVRMGLSWSTYKKLREAA